MKRMKITSFFKPKVPKKSDDEVARTPSTSTAASGSQCEPDAEDGEGILSSGTLPPPVDIAKMVRNKRATDAEKLAVINQKAPSVETLPYTEEGGHKRRFQPGWCSKYPWLKYSASQKGGYCVACVLFTGDAAGTGGQTRLGTLVLQPMIKYKKATELLCSHNCNAYHRTAMVKMEQFLNTISHPTRAIDAILDRKRKEQIESNRRLLVPVIETVLFCGRNMLALRGHRDDGPLDLTVPSTTGEGVFRALLRYRTQGGDTELKRLLTSTAKNSTLISKTIQNELISIAGRLIQEELVTGVTGTFAVLMDETTDVSGKEQATIIIRHFEEEIREDFLAFVHAEDLTGKGLAWLLLRTVEDLGLDMAKCRGLGFDGASSMMGKFKGCAAVLMKKYTLAKPIHCFNHRLNLVLTKACDVKEVKIALQTLTDVYNFIYSSNMRSLRFTEVIKLTSANREKLVPLCPTRWIERHDAVLVFVELLPVIAVFLEEELDATAGLLLIALRNPRFLVGLVVVECILAHTLEPSRTLQRKDGDLVLAYATIRGIETIFAKFRADAENHFHNIFMKAEELLVEVGSLHDTIPVPRLCGRQTQRSNVPCENAEEYYRRAVYIPFVDHVLAELKSRFGDDTVPVALQLKQLLKGPETDVAAVFQAAKLYERDIESLTLAKAEAERWTLSVPVFQTIKEAQAHASTSMFPNLATLLKTLLTLPVTNAEAERSFSALKRLKTYLRSTVGQERLNGLALLCVHNDIPISVDRVISKFAEKNRRLLFD